MTSGPHRIPSPPHLWSTLIAALIIAGGCKHPQPGVLTLAPAGMRTTGACISQPDGTLIMPAGASAAAVVYADAGTVTVTITATASSLAHHPQVELWFSGDQVGTLPFQDTTAQVLPFHAQARTSGATALRIVYGAGDGTGDDPAPTLHVEKVVITEP